MGKSIIALILPLLLFSSAVAQKPEESIFSPVPAESRASLIERLQVMLELQRKDDRRALYEMMFGPLASKFTKEEFINLSATTRVVEFTPRRVDKEQLDLIPGASWRIAGDATVRDADGREQKKQGIVFAQYRNGEWYFTGVLTLESVLRRIELKPEIKPPA